MSPTDTLFDGPTVPTTPETEPSTVLLPPASPSEVMRKKLAESPLPLRFSELRKGITKPRKQSTADFESELRNLLDEQARAGQAFSHPSGKNAEVRYWSKDEKHALREEALNLAAPGTLAELSKKLVPVSKADAVFIESGLRDLIAEGELFEHPPKKPNGPARFAIEKYESPNNKPAVTEALIGAAGTPRPVKELVKVALAGTRADKAFVEEVLNELITTGRLHEHPGRGSAKPYGVEPPKRIRPLENPKHLKALEKLSNDARKLLDKSGAELDDLLQRLRTLLSEGGLPAPDQPALEPPVQPMPEQAAQAPSAPQASASAAPEKIEELIVLPEVHQHPL